MPYIILVVGVIIGLYALYRFFLNANVQQIKAFGLSFLAMILGGAIFALAITGRFPAAAALIAAMIPVIMGILQVRQKIREQASPAAELEAMDAKQAREILSVGEDADEKEIKEAYKKLMQKVHPDNEGSEWMAAKLNQARDILLKDK